ncbi:MAG: hypothetical protein K0R28_6934, partial [Paenibacillus sp.]|nr:hypothetical protein [Paenibacillus sp.]
EIKAYLRAYEQTGYFSGTILAARDGRRFVVL